MDIYTQFEEIDVAIYCINAKADSRSQLRVGELLITQAPVLKRI